jgi:tRNA dimethylallyltransferase
MANAKSADFRSPHLTFLLGATAVGKSAVALELARRSGAAILALDAMQVYRGADIGTGKPSAAERAEVPHGGLDLVEFGGAFAVAHYLAHAAEFLREHAARGVIIVGGTGLYFRALTQGLCEAPQGSDELRAELRGLSLEELRARLERVDAPMLAQVDAANPRRLARAIEVMETTGRSLRAWQEETPAPLVTNFRAFWLQREKEELHARIEERVEAMLAAGWVEEVRGLVSRHGEEAVRAFPAIGYRELAEVVAGRAKLEEARSNILVATRQYAKRQLTWFAREPNLQPVMLAAHQPFPADLFAPL